MIRVAFTIIGGDNWTGGHHYLHNLLRVLTAEFSERIEPVLFVAEAGGSRGIGDFEALEGLEIVATPLLNATRGRLSLVQSIFWGRDSSLVRLFNEQRIDLVFDAAQFYGWRLGIPAIAWIPDFQHLSLPQMFSAAGRWKREIGFRAQMFGGRRIMLSSDDARRICLKHYALAESRTRTVHFAVPAGTRIPLEEARRVAGAVFLHAQSALAAQEPRARDRGARPAQATRNTRVHSRVGQAERSARPGFVRAFDCARRATGRC